MTLLRAYRSVTLIGVGTAWAGLLCVYLARNAGIFTAGALLLALLSTVAMGVIQLRLHRVVIAAGDLPRLSDGCQNIEFDGRLMRVDTVHVELDRGHGVTACFGADIEPRIRLTLTMADISPYNVRNQSYHGNESL